MAAQTRKLRHGPWTGRGGSVLVRVGTESLKDRSIELFILHQDVVEHGGQLINLNRDWSVMHPRLGCHEHGILARIFQCLLIGDINRRLSLVPMIGVPCTKLVIGNFRDVEVSPPVVSDTIGFTPRVDRFSRFHGRKIPGGGPVAPLVGLVQPLGAGTPFRLHSHGRPF